MFRAKNNDLAGLAAKIEKVEAEIAETERAGPPLEARQAEALAKLEAAAQHFRIHGFAPHGIGLDQQIHFLRMTMIGALATIDRDAIVKSERERVARAFEAAGGLGMTESAKAERIASLRAELRRMNASREIAWRREEGDGAIAERVGFDPAMFLSDDRDLAMIANGKEAPHP